MACSNTITLGQCLTYITHTETVDIKFTVDQMFARLCGVDTVNLDMLPCGAKTHTSSISLHCLYWSWSLHNGKIFHMYLSYLVQMENVEYVTGL